MLVLTWNLFHGRRTPPARARGSQLDAFAGALAGWAWDVALLQEVPPWWPARLGAATGASARMVLTSRNEPLVLRRALAEPFPDLLKSGGGGCNAILVRSQRITAHRTLRLRWLPERRCAHGVLLGDGTWIVNTHGEASRRELAREDLDAVAGAADRWAGDAPRILLGGDLNLTGRPAAPGYAHLAGHHVDHLLARGLAATGPGELLPAGGLSDHRPLLLDTYPRAP